MALMFLLMLWDLTFFIQGVTSSCNVTCSTDYDTSLNCSCVPGFVLTHPVLVSVSCSDGDFEVTDSCQINPPQSWCVMLPEEFIDVVGTETKCNATVSQQGGQEIIMREESKWDLSRVVKSPPPSNVNVTNTEGLYNITWDKDDDEVDCFTYRVRIRESKDLSKDIETLPVDQKYILLDHKKLKPLTDYTVDVQAKFCPENLYQGPWSEWSSTAEWRTPGTSDGIEGWWIYILLVIILVAVLLLGYSQKPFWLKKLQQIIDIPSANEFFKPLYQNYEGNFKNWVNPTFSEYDYCGVDTHVDIITEKQHDVLHWNNEKQSYNEDKEMKQSGRFLHVLQPHCNSLLHFQDGRSSQGTGHSTGHISIHTVTLSGEEEFEEEVMSQSSVNTLRSYQDGESFASYDGDNREHAGYDLEPQMSRMDRQNGILPEHENQISHDPSVGNLNFQPHAQFNEPERVSLDSFVSNEQSEDGYPHVDLDTIDSGFGECSSPGTAEHRDSDLFHEHKNSNSNYVKQWMICSTIQEDSSNSENKLHETQ